MISLTTDYKWNLIVRFYQLLLCFFFFYTCFSLEMNPPWSLPCSDWLLRLLGQGRRVLLGQWMGDTEGVRLEEEHISSPLLLLTGPMRPSDLVRCSPWVFGEGCDWQGETAKGSLAGGADSGLSVFVRGPDGLMELEKTSERGKYKGV